MGDLQMLEEQGAALGNGTPLRDFLFTAAFLSSSRFGAMVSLFCCQSELQLSRERRCQDICCDRAGDNFYRCNRPCRFCKKAFIYTHTVIAFNLPNGLGNWNGNWWIFISFLRHFPIQSQKWGSHIRFVLSRKRGVSVFFTESKAVILQLNRFLITHY